VASEGAEAVRYSAALEEQLRWLRWLRLEKSTGGPEWASQRIDYTEQALEFGETFYWSSQVQDIIDSVSHSMPENWRFRVTAIPSRRGFFWFEQGLAMAERDSKYARVRAISWSTGVLERTSSPAFNLSCFVENVDPSVPPTLQSFVIHEGQTAREAVSAVVEQAEDAGGDYLPCLAAMLSFAACLEFLQDRILVASHQEAERPTRRRMAKAGFEHEPVVRVVELRRKQARSERDGDPVYVEWSHQWIVSGHWRQQWYPSLNDYQPRWIMPYVKGPEDKPLKPPRAKVFAVVR
jgi:hypothetical protein